MGSSCAKEALEPLQKINILSLVQLRLEKTEEFASELVKLWNDYSRYSKEERKLLDTLMGTLSTPITQKTVQTA
jgi:hypothetical protein